MSAEGKDRILQRLNAQNVISRPSFGGRTEGTSRFDPGMKPKDYDPKNPGLIVQAFTKVSLRQVFGNAPTWELYDVRNLIDEILGTRPDAKR